MFALPQWGSKIGHQNPKNEENLQHQKLLQPIQTKLRKHGKGEETSEKEDDKVAWTPSMRTYKKNEKKKRIYNNQTLYRCYQPKFKHQPQNEKKKIREEM